MYIYGFVLCYIVGLISIIYGKDNLKHDISEYSLILIFISLFSWVGLLTIITCEIFDRLSKSHKGK